MKRAILLFLLVFVLLPATAANAGEVLDRVMKEGKIRCGYAMWPPMMYMDVNSGELQGVAHDLTEALGKNLDLEIRVVRGSQLGQHHRRFCYQPV